MKSRITGPDRIQLINARKVERSMVNRRQVLTGAAATGAAVLLAGHNDIRHARAGQSIEGNVNMRVWSIGVGVEEFFQGLAQEFQNENPGIEVGVEVVPGADRYPKMLADLAAGQGPDVMFITTDVLIRFAEAGVISPLDDLLSEETWANYRPEFIEEVSYEGSRWFMPMDKEMPVWMTNPAIFEQAGLDPTLPPGTWDEIRKVCEQVKAIGDPNIYGWGYPAASATLNMTFYPFLYQAGGRPISEDSSEPTFNSEAGVEALNFIVELFEQKWASQQWLSPVESGQDPFLLGSQAVSSFGFLADLIEVRTLAPEMQPGLTPILSHKEKWGFGSMRSWAMSNTAQNREAAAAFLNFLARPENMLRHSEQFGVYPTKTTAVDQAYADSPDLAALADQLPYVFGEQKHKYGRDMMPIVIAEIQAAILKQKTPKEALDDAAAQVIEVFAQG